MHTCVGLTRASTFSAPQAWTAPSSGSTQRWTCIYTYTHTYIYVCIYIYISTYIYICIQAHTHMLANPVFNSLCTAGRDYAKRWLCAEVDIYTYIYTYIHTYTYVYTHTRTHTRTHTHLLRGRARCVAPRASADAASAA